VRLPPRASHLRVSRERGDHFTTKRATWRPSLQPSRSEVRKWDPTNARASFHLLHDLLKTIEAARRPGRRLLDVGRMVKLCSVLVRGWCGVSWHHVVLLIAAGKTNREIGKALFISEKPVARHVSNIFDKLGVSSSIDATAWARQRYLIWT
jgi:DNA-binding CsgD family transcriptional regulator